MINNDILRRLRYSFELNDKQMIAIFAQADSEVTRAQVSDWLKKEDDAAYQNLSDPMLATFLNGFINLKRGKRDGEQPKPEARLSNNVIFRKLKIALALEAEQIIDILAPADQVLSKHELSALFRKSDHKHYRECKDQLLRNFLKGLQLRYRGDRPADNAAAMENRGSSSASSSTSGSPRPTVKRATKAAKRSTAWPGAKKPKLQVVVDGKLRPTLSVNKPSEDG